MFRLLFEVTHRLSVMKPIAWNYDRQKNLNRSRWGVMIKHKHDLNSQCQYYILVSVYCISTEMEGRTGAKSAGMGLFEY